MSTPNMPPPGQQPPPPNPYYPPYPQPPYYPPPPDAIGYSPPAAPEQRGLQWWHWLLISGGGVIAICCILSAALVALSTIAASRTTPPTAFPSLTATANNGISGQATCDLATHHCTSAPVMAIDQNATYIATITTSKGDIVITLDASNAPIAVNNFVFLAQAHWYDGTYFWRVETPGKPSPIDPGGAPSQLSLIQGGSVAPNGNDSSDVPGYTIQDDNPLPADYSAGTISMANTGMPDTASSQFFIDIADESRYFSHTYVTFGKVVQGMDVVKRIAPDDRIVTISITVQAD